MDSERVIDMTEEELIAANLAALGIPADAIRSQSDDAVFDGFVRVAQQIKDIPKAAEVEAVVGIPRRAISEACARLLKAGRMVQVPSKRTGKPGYLPIVTGAKG